MPVYAIERKSTTGPPWTLNKKTGILIQAKSREEAADMLGGHVHDDHRKKIFFKRSELEKNPAWKEIEHASTDIADIFSTTKATTFALEVAPELYLHVTFFGDQESHLDDHPWGPVGFPMRFSDPTGSIKAIPVEYWFHLEETGTLYKQKASLLSSLFKPITKLLALFI